MTTAAPIERRIQPGRVLANRHLCREHLRLTLRVDQFSAAQPGQFVHLCPTCGTGEDSRTGVCDYTTPMLRRAFSIAGLVRGTDGVDLDVIYRVVGTATRWMESLHEGDSVSVLGPLGHAFPIRPDKPEAWLVAGGVGLPPMLWLAESLRAAGRRAVAFCGAQRADLVPLTLNAGAAPDSSATSATLCAAEFSRVDTPAVISTDDGSLGFRGYVGSAMAAYHRANPVAADQLAVYTCGPEAMMRFVAEYCMSRGIECHVCVERNMACGTGMCQSCVVPVCDTADPEGWAYRLCCTDGPIFEARDLRWEPPR